MAKKEKKEPEGPSTAWMNTYGDMITLMLCFFVMLYNPTEIDAVQSVIKNNVEKTFNTFGG